MMRYLFIAIIGMFSFLNSCSEEEEFKTYCIDFDVRQCEGNPWLVDNTLPESSEDHLELVTQYLEENNIKVLHREIDNQYHTIVCEACYVCPAGPRIRVEILPKDTALIYSLELLNISTIECPDEF